MGPHFVSPPKRLARGRRLLRNFIAISKNKKKSVSMVIVNFFLLVSCDKRNFILEKTVKVSTSLFTLYNDSILYSAV